MTSPERGTQAEPILVALSVRSDREQQAGLEVEISEEY